MTTNIRVKTKICINGREYASVEEMPDGDRQLYERMPHGGDLAHPLSSTKIVLNGREYGSVDEMPGAARKLYEEVLASVDANQNDLPDALEAAAPSVTASGSLGAARPDSTRAWLVLAAIVMALWVIASFQFGR